MNKVKAAFSDYLKNKGLKLTQQRLAILDSVIHTQGHFTAETLFQKMREAKIPAGKATVYRTLEILAEGGFLEAHNFLGAGSTYYEKILGREHHDHMICMSCGKFIEFQCEEIERLQQAKAKEHKFTMVSHSLKLFGNCAACAKKEKKQED